MRVIGFLAVGLMLTLALPAHAEATQVPDDLLGRRNPFRPLIAPQRAPQDLPESPSAPVPPGLPRHSTPPLSVLERLEYVGIAYDETEAIAAVSDGERTWFVRMGDRLEGAAVSSITPHKLTWSRNGRAIVKHLRREGVY